MESRRFLWRDARLVMAPLAPVWSVLAIISLTVGLCWRYLPAADPPSLYALLDICGVALWLAGWPLAQSLVAATRRRNLHLLHADDSLPRLSVVGLALVGLALCMALAPSALLLAYSPHAILQTLSTQDIAQINVNLGLVWVGTLILGGTLYVLGSCVLALLALRTGRLAPLVWLLAGGYLQLSVLAGLAEHIPRIEPGGETIFSWVPPTLGIMSRSAMARLADPGIRYEYANPLADSAVAGSFLGILVLASACIWLAVMANYVRRAWELLPLTAAGSILCMLVYVFGQLWVYATNPGVSSPGSWRAVLTLGPLTACFLCWIWSGYGRTPSRGNHLWLLTVVVSAIALTAPQLRAGQGSQVEVLWQAALLAGPFLLTMHSLLSGARDGAISHSGAWWLCCLVLLTLPLDGRASMLDAARQWSLQGTNGYVAAGVICLLMLAYLARTGILRDRVRLIRSLRPTA